MKKQIGLTVCKSVVLPVYERDGRLIVGEAFRVFSKKASMEFKSRLNESSDPEFRLATEEDVEAALQEIDEYVKTRRGMQDTAIFGAKWTYLDKKHIGVLA